jgi:hypothetical protein
LSLVSEDAERKCPGGVAIARNDQHDRLIEELPVAQAPGRTGVDDEDPRRIAYLVRMRLLNEGNHRAADIRLGLGEADAANDREG